MADKSTHRLDRGACQSLADSGFANWHRALPIGSCRPGGLAAGRHGVLGAEGETVIGVGKYVGVMGISVVARKISAQGGPSSLVSRTLARDP
jgi:hypothetical protein